MARTCPDDGTALDTKSIHDLQVDICPTCGGIWLDRGEIAKLKQIPATEVKGLESAPANASGPRSSNPQCPVCGLALTPFVYYAGGNAHLETCPNLDGIWVPAAQLDTICTVHALTPEQQHVVDAFTMQSRGITDHYDRAESVLRTIGYHIPWPL